MSKNCMKQREAKPLASPITRDHQDELEQLRREKDEEIERLNRELEKFKAEAWGREEMALQAAALQATTQALSIRPRSDVDEVNNDDMDMDDPIEDLAIIPFQDLDNPVEDMVIAEGEARPKRRRRAGMIIE
ncbi:hypothetical protein P280DRAFT_139569 [Massarina eburnea CBS 473.64]|uniref:Uncharacterized protein n=1 Tax=Massarina eburnea CBS 473.64 TaxID=1395130 RepID=A0A6A6RP76_9PLEO|nr:hypothetical protein P280DRAFT_139569 [Massarina eburnea CBS 473.64]